MTNQEIAIRTVDDIKEMSKILGTSALLPTQLRGKPADVFVTVMYGHELGLTPMAAVQGIYVVNGRPTMSAQTWIALARRAGHRIKVDEHTDQLCTVTITRGDTGETHTSTYTYAEAQQAKLTSKDVWQQHRKAMLLARAVSSGCRFICPEIALGYYAEGEVFEDAPAPIEQATAPLGHEVVDAEIVPEPEAVAADLFAAAADYAQPSDI